MKSKLVKPSIFRRYLYFFGLFIVLSLKTIHCQAGDNDVRHPFIAGSFYPSDPVELEQMVDGFLDKASPGEIPKDKIKMLIVPHAGFIYSGQTAAFAYKLMQGSHFDTVVMIGPYHKANFEGASVWKRGLWKTPLGNTPVDEELAEKIASESPKFSFTQDAHLAEHSLETQLPFLQKVLKNFKIVPILISNPSSENVGLLARAIAKHVQDKKVLIVVSTDMSHYFGDLTARVMDQKALELLKNQDAASLSKGFWSKEIEFCGFAAVLTGLEISRLLGNTKLEFLHYSNSGDSSGDYSRVVGYGASTIIQMPSGGSPSGSQAQPSDYYDLAQRQQLLEIARQTLTSFVTTGKIPEFSVSDPALKEERAVFVTLKKNGHLRGCIGSLFAQESLYMAVRNMTVQSASNDQRFRPVESGELKDIDIEISVLTPPRLVRSADEIILGRDGVIIRQGTRSGVFLPQVATETLWTKERFLSELCSQKAGLEPDCWKDSRTELSIFSAEAFEEKS